MQALRGHADAFMTIERTRGSKLAGGSVRVSCSGAMVAGESDYEQEDEASGSEPEPESRATTSQRSVSAKRKAAKAPAASARKRSKHTTTAASRVDERCAFDLLNVWE